ncbi:ArnT family glycosyltransferase [Niabella drilacis]|uniref:Dolichyl-phosphate-mannose-protein mannosyltransferase n=1 Tax=Niabella drilacis (strain DSM 25811 / CCM 8410 / CCUG 62505 / LMG 26954 / E90) TaxID=1285928 RepID=A0A1G7BMP3_NIADE|nr:glycosyltransferase family 39 protein [Niabella drilacis]SDE28339.1 Dolichyl-phosphate-mannose-protein mannosyltransferase [Niabella drilacis]
MPAHTDTFPSFSPGSTGTTRTMGSDTRLLAGFMILWFLINSLQAIFLGIDGDEAYYWMLSQNLQWGYFDHPPLVTVFIRLGEFFGHGPFFTRLGTILLSTCSIALVYRGLPGYLQKIRWFILLYAATLVLNVYAFITTPDAALFFFAALFFLRYKLFLNQKNFINSLWLAIAITGMFYSKYHGILLVGFVVLSNLKLLTNKYFWLIVLMVSLLFLPHLYWQYLNDWPTVRFHLIERIAKKYRVSYTTDYLLGQILIWGPLISLPFYIFIFKLKIRDTLMRAHLFMFAGTLIFFLFSSFKNTVEPHWTMIAGISYIAVFLSLIVNGSQKFRSLFLKTAWCNIGLILLARILFLVPNGPANLIKHFRSFSYARVWADAVYEKAGHTPVVFSNSYALPSLYKFYHPDAQTTGYNDKGYRKTNFNITDDHLLNGRNVFYYTENTSLKPGTGIPVGTVYNSGRLLPLPQYHSLNGLRIILEHPTKEMKYGSEQSMTLTIINKSGQAQLLEPKLRADYAFLVEKYNFINSDSNFALPLKTLQPGESIRLNIPVKAPQQPGKYRLLFSFVNDFIPGNFASNFYQITVNGE